MVRKCIYEMVNSKTPGFHEVTIENPNNWREKTIKVCE
jgi:hypothetical protein